MKSLAPNFDALSGLYVSFRSEYVSFYSKGTYPDHRVYDVIENPNQVALNHPILDAYQQFVRGIQERSRVDDFCELSIVPYTKDFKNFSGTVCLIHSFFSPNEYERFADFVMKILFPVKSTSLRN